MNPRIETRVIDGAMVQKKPFIKTYENNQISIAEERARMYENLFSEYDSNFNGQGKKRIPLGERISADTKIKLYRLSKYQNRRAYARRMSYY